MLPYIRIRVGAGTNTSATGFTSDTILVMLVADFLTWWYGQGWKSVFASFGPRLQGVQDLFSVKQLLRTLFEPWRRIITYPGDSFAEKFRAWGDNVVSRAVGFTVRCLMLLASVLSSAAVLAFTLFEALVWPLLPLAIPLLIIWGLL